MYDIELDVKPDVELDIAPDAAPDVEPWLNNCIEALVNQMTV